MKEDERGGIIPDYGAVIFDEAHEIEDVAGQYFGVSRFELPVRGADARRGGRWLIARSSDRRELDRILITLDERAAQFFALFGASEGRRDSARTRRSSMQNEEAYRDVLRALELVALQLELLKAAPEEAIPLVHRAREIARRLQFWMEVGRDERYVYWIERRGRGTFLQATPIDVSPAAG